MQKDINKFMIVEKRQSANKKRPHNNNSHNAISYISQGTPDKNNNNNIKGILNALNCSMNSA